MSKKDFNKKNASNKPNVTWHSIKGRHDFFEALIKSGHKLFPAPGNIQINTGVIIVDSRTPTVITQSDLEKTFLETTDLQLSPSLVFICGKNISLAGEFKDITIFDPKDNTLHKSECCFIAGMMHMKEYLKGYAKDLDLITPFFEGDLHRFSLFFSEYISSADVLTFCAKQCKVICKTYTEQEISDFVTSAEDRIKTVHGSGFEDGSNTYEEPILLKPMLTLLKAKLIELKAHKALIKGWRP